MSDDRFGGIPVTIYVDPDGSVTITDLVEELLPVANALGELPRGLQERAREVARRRGTVGARAETENGRAGDE